MVFVTFAAPFFWAKKIKYIVTDPAKAGNSQPKNNAMAYVWKKNMDTPRIKRDTTRP